MLYSQLMKAVVLARIGNIKDLTYTSLPIPKPKKDEVLVKVLYCGINHLDLHIIAGTRPGPKNFPHILGSEIVGERDGEKVALYPWTFCGNCVSCKNGEMQICERGGTLGRTCWGGYAEYVAVPEKNIIKIPQNVSFEDICSITLAGTTAYHLIQRARIRDKSTVLVTGGTGGVGTAVIQLLKQKQCHIICATSHPNKIKELKKLSVAKIVLVKDMVSLLTYYPSGIDCAIDIVGGSVWSNALRLLSKNGTLVFCATSRLESGTVDIARTFSRQLNILGSYGGSLTDLKEVITLLEKGVIRPQIDSIFPLSDTKKALEKMKEQRNFGKLLLRI